MDHTPVYAEIMPTQDRQTVIVLFRADVPIPAPALLESLKSMSDTLEKKLSVSKIEVQKPKLITP